MYPKPFPLQFQQSIKPNNKTSFVLHVLLHRAKKCDTKLYFLCQYLHRQFSQQFLLCLSPEPSLSQCYSKWFQEQVPSLKKQKGSPITLDQNISLFNSLQHCLESVHPILSFKNIYFFDNYFLKDYFYKITKKEF